MEKKPYEPITAKPILDIDPEIASKAENDPEILFSWIEERIRRGDSLDQNEK